MRARASEDAKLTRAYFAAIRANTMTRCCLCCREEFETDQAYRLCETCRSGEIFSPQQYPVPEFMEVA